MRYFKNGIFICTANLLHIVFLILYIQGMLIEEYHDDVLEAKYNKIMKLYNVTEASFHEVFISYLISKNPSMIFEYLEYRKDIFDAVTMVLFSKVIKNFPKTERYDVMWKFLSGNADDLERFAIFSSITNKTTKSQSEDIERVIEAMGNCFYIVAFRGFSLSTSTLRFINKLTKSGIKSILLFRLWSVDDHFDFRGADLTQVVKLSIYGSILTRIPRISGLKNLEILDLSGNNITSLDVSHLLLEANRILDLDLQLNPIEDFQPSENFSKIFPRLRRIKFTKSTKKAMKNCKFLGQILKRMYNGRSVTVTQMPPPTLHKY